MDGVVVLALIPARGGSKSIPRKNIKPLGSYPLIAYSIAAGLQAACRPRVIVSTDDEEIAAVAREYGAEVPFLRPAELAQDATLDLPVFQHALRWLEENEGDRPEIVIQLRPTSPFRPEGMVDEAVRILRDHPDATSVRGIVPSGQNPYKMWRLGEAGPMHALLESDIAEAYNRPRQELPPTYWQTGHIDAIRSEVILRGSMSGEAVYPLRIDPKYTVDLDTALDWERAEWRLRDPEMGIVQPLETGSGYRVPGAGPVSSEAAELVVPDNPLRTSHVARPLPHPVELIIFDFDGVMTDNTAYVDQDGIESVRVSRGDGMGIDLLRAAGVDMFVLSTEPNPVVAARCRKLGLDYMHGVGKKGEALPKILKERGVDPANTIYLGNDVNDLPCFPLVGCAVVVADAHPDVIGEADIVLSKPGGHGAVRELADRVLGQQGRTHTV